MTHHPHVHMIVPGGGLSEDSSRWIAAKPDFLVHVNVLRTLFRGKVLGLLGEAHAEGRLQFFGKLAPLADKKTFKRFLAPLRRIDWVVYCKDPFGGPEQVLRYLSRYTHRVVLEARLRHDISNRRLIAADDGGVSFRWKDYRIEGPERWKTMTLCAHEFIRRFLIHVLPSWRSQAALGRASIASGTTVCSPTATAPRASPRRASFSPWRRHLRSRSRPSLPVTSRVRCRRRVRAAAGACTSSRCSRAAHSQGISRHRRHPGSGSTRHEGTQPTGSQCCRSPPLVVHRQRTLADDSARPARKMPSERASDVIETSSRRLS